MDGTPKIIEFFRGRPRGGDNFTSFSSAPDHLFKASTAPFFTLRVATPSRAPRQAPLEKKNKIMKFVNRPSRGELLYASFPGKECQEKVVHTQSSLVVGGVPTVWANIDNKKGRSWQND